MFRCMYPSTFEKPGPVWISGDVVILIELNIDWMNISFGLILIKTNIKNDNSPKICF